MRTDCQTITSNNHYCKWNIILWTTQKHWIYPHIISITLLPLANHNSSMLAKINNYLVFMWTVNLAPWNEDVFFQIFSFLISQIGGGCCFHKTKTHKFKIGYKDFDKVLLKGPKQNVFGSYLLEKVDFGAKTNKSFMLKKYYFLKIECTDFFSICVL